MSMLEVHGATASYGGITAIRDVSLAVAAGQMVALIGPNGAGKSTLLNTISGFVRPVMGGVRLLGREIGGVAPHVIARLGLLHVPEGRRILGPLSVQENLLLGLLATRGRVRPAADGLERVFALFPRLAERRSQLAGSMSGGEQQMLAIGRALMGQPILLLLDEPSLGLSPKMAAEVFEALVRLNAGGLPILLVEQNARLALDVAQYAYVIERGTIVHHGTAAALRDEPAIAEHYFGASEGARKAVA